VDGKDVHNWLNFWLSSSIGSAAILVMVAAFFRSHSSIRTKDVKKETPGLTRARRLESKKEMTFLR
jgi:hypothetical protein